MSAKIIRSFPLQIEIFLPPSKAPIEVDNETWGGWAFTLIGIVNETAESGSSGSEYWDEFKEILNITFVNPAFDNWIASAPTDGQV